MALYKFFEFSSSQISSHCSVARYRGQGCGTLGRVTRWTRRRHVGQGGQGWQGWARILLRRELRGRGSGSSSTLASCMGAIDGTMIKIKAPPVREDVNVQFACDSNLRFLDAVIKYPGSVTDKAIWSMCGLKEKLVNFLGPRGSNYRG